MHVRRLHPADATTVRDLRLRGLQESPTAFGSSYEEEVDHPIATIAELLAEAMRAARGMPGLRQVTLAVTAGNLAAIATYEGCGFKAYGTAPQALHVQGRYYDEIHMVCHLDAG